MASCATTRTLLAQIILGCVSSSHLPLSCTAKLTNNSFATHRSAPTWLLNVEQYQEVDLHISGRMNEDYVAPQGPRAFVGSGHRLGAPTPEAVPSTSPSSSMPGGFPGAAAAGSSSAVAPAEPAAINTRFEVDQSLPTTSVQIRLADGTRYAS